MNHPYLNVLVGSYMLGFIENDLKPCDRGIQVQKSVSCVLM